MPRTEGAIVTRPYLSSARAYAWARMRRMHKLDRDFSITEIVEHLERRGVECERSNTRVYVKALLMAGVLETVANGRNGKPGRFRLVRDLGTLPPVEREDGNGITDPNALRKPRVCTTPMPGTGRALIWKAVRVFGQRRAVFTANDVHLLVDGGDRPVSLNAIHRYLRTLTLSGHLSTNGRKPPEFRVLHDSGPLNPILRDDGDVYDPNEQVVYPCEVPA